MCPRLVFATAASPRTPHELARRSSGWSSESLRILLTVCPRGPPSGRTRPLTAGMHRDDFARIRAPARIEHLAEIAHGAESRRREQLVHVRQLVHADAVLAGDAAAHGDAQLHDLA